MAEIIAFSALAVFGIGYGIKSALTAKRDARRNAAYREKVMEYTVRRGHPIQSNYSDFERKIESGEVVLNSPRNPRNNEVYNALSNVVSQHDENGEYIEVRDDYDLLQLEPDV